jgi:dTDP-4-amino-4,6-dideoxygalactose transaminase
MQKEAKLKKAQRMSIPFALPDCGDEEIREVADVIKSGWLTTASRCAQFELKFAKFIGSRYALGVNSGTAALHLGLEALGIGEGDRVLVPTFTFTATAEVVRYLRADPIFVDCDRETFCITSEEIEKTIDTPGSMLHAPSLGAIIPVHFGGHPCEMESILQLAESKGIRVIEDASHAFPTRYNGRIIGTYGDITCFSFYANKTITTGEGGMLCTDDDEVANRVKVMRLHGIDHDIVAPGFKYNMPDICAALGIQQLRKAKKLRERRQKIAEAYYERLKDIPGLILPRIQCAIEDHSWHLFNVLIDPDETKGRMDRNQFITEMTVRGVGTSVHYKPLHGMTYYKNRYELRPEMFPNAEWVFQRCVCLPIFSAMTEAQLAYVIRNVKEILL